MMRKFLSGCQIFHVLERKNLPLSYETLYSYHVIKILEVQIAFISMFLLYVKTLFNFSIIVKFCDKKLVDQHLLEHKYLFCS